MRIGEKPLEITVQTADHSHSYTPSIIPLKLPSSPSTSDITDDIKEREPFDKLHVFRPKLDPYRRNSRDDNDEDTEDSDTMSSVRLHNREHAAHSEEKSHSRRDYGTQVEEKPTRTIGTMCEPIKTRNFGNEVQPQSSATQTSRPVRQPQQEDHEIDIKQTASPRLKHDARTNEHYPSQRGISLDQRNKYVSPRVRHHKDHLDDDQYRPRHRSQYDEEPRSEYIIATDDYRPHPSSRTRHRNSSSSSPRRTHPPPPEEYRLTSPNGRYRTPSPSNHRQHRLPPTQRSRSRSPPVKKHISTSTNQHPSVLPLSQRRSRSSQRSTSPQFSKHHVPSSSVHRTPSPQAYRSKLPNGHQSPSPPPSQNFPRRAEERPMMSSVQTDTSLDGMKSSEHRHRRSKSPPTREFGTVSSEENQHPSQTNHSNNLHKRPSYSDYEKLDANPPKAQDRTKHGSYQDNYKALRDDQPPSTQKKYRLRPVPNDSFTNNYEEMPSKHNESILSPFNGTFEHPKEYTPKPLIDDPHRHANPPVTQRSIDDRKQHHPTTFDDETADENYIQELPTGGSVSIPPTTVIQPDTLPRSYGQTNSLAYQNHHHDNSRKIPELPLHRGQELRASPSANHSPLLNFGTPRVTHQSPANEVAPSFKIRYIQEADDEFSTDNSNIRSSTLKRADLRSKSHQILLLPVLNSSRTYVFEKQSLPANRLRQSRTNGNFYLASSPTLHTLNTSFPDDDFEIDPLIQMDSDRLAGHPSRPQVA